MKTIKFLLSEKNVVLLHNATLSECVCTIVERVRVNHDADAQNGHVRRFKVQPVEPAKYDIYYLYNDGQLEKTCTLSECVRTLVDRILIYQPADTNGYVGKYEVRPFEPRKINLSRLEGEIVLISTSTHFLRNWCRPACFVFSSTVTLLERLQKMFTMRLTPADMVTVAEKWTVCTKEQALHDYPEFFF